jgi:hypothetical protein
MSINVHIERLVLEGIDLAPTDRARLGAAAQAELTRLLRRHGLDAHIAAGGNLRRLPGGSIDLAPGAVQIGLGAQIAGAIFDGLGPAGSRGDG